MNNSSRIFLVTLARYVKRDSRNSSGKSTNREDVVDCNSDYTNLPSSRNPAWSIGVTARCPCLTYRRYRASQLLRLPLCWLRPTILNRYVNRRPHCKRKQQQDWKIRHSNNISARWTKSRRWETDQFAHTSLQYVTFFFFRETFSNILSVLLIGIVLRANIWMVSSIFDI